MPDKDASTPRVFLARHGETEWSVSGRYTGTTDIPLTVHGEGQVLATGRTLVGAGKLLPPAKLARVFISPMSRAQKTFDLLFCDAEADRETLRSDDRVTTTDALREWNYGDYEGLLTNEIKAKRKERGLDAERPWDIWRDGCENGESPEQFAKRLDELIAQIVDIQRNNMNGEAPADVLVIAHGHTLRAFTKRWLKYSLDFPLSMVMESGAVAVLSYQHHSVDEPAFMLGTSFGGR